jgi:hypothetical protein
VLALAVTPAARKAPTSWSSLGAARAPMSPLRTEDLVSGDDWPLDCLSYQPNGAANEVPPYESALRAPSVSRLVTRSSRRQSFGEGHAELVMQGKSLEQEVSSRRPRRSDRSTPPDDGSHRLVECRPATPTSMVFARTRYWRGTAATPQSQAATWFQLANVWLTNLNPVFGRPAFGLERFPPDFNPHGARSGTLRAPHETCAAKRTEYIT